MVVGVVAAPPAACWLEVTEAPWRQLELTLEAELWGQRWQVC